MSGEQFFKISRSSNLLTLGGSCGPGGYGGSGGPGGSVVNYI